MTHIFGMKSAGGLQHGLPCWTSVLIGHATSSARNFIAFKSPFCTAVRQAPPAAPPSPKSGPPATIRGTNSSKRRRRRRRKRNRRQHRANGAGNRPGSDDGVELDNGIGIGAIGEQSSSLLGRARPRQRHLSSASDDSYICFEPIEENDTEDDFFEDEDETDCPTKVRFSDNVEVHKMVKWSFAYKQARSGPWEQYARDRERFMQRCFRTNRIIGGVFEPNHRDRIYKERFSTIG